MNLNSSENNCTDMVYVCAELNVSFHGSMAENPGVEGGGGGTTKICCNRLTHFHKMALRAAVQLPSELHSNPMLVYSFTYITTHINALQCVHNLSLQSNMLFPKNWPENQLSSISKDFLKQSHMTYYEAVLSPIGTCYRGFGKFYRFCENREKCASVPWWSLNFCDSINVCTMHM